MSGYDAHGYSKKVMIKKHDDIPGIASWRLGNLSMGSIDLTISEPK